MSSVALQVGHLFYRFPTSDNILSDISFSLTSGECMVVTGRNGSGKSVLMRCLKGLTIPNSGTITIGTEDVSRRAKRRNELIGMVFQDAETQIVGQTVQRDMLFGLENLRLPPEERTQRFEEIVELFQLSPFLLRRPRTLSGGEQRRVAIAGVLAMKPQILILDEPFANLDYEGVIQVLKTILHIKEQGHTLIIVTHEIEKILAHADAMLLIEKGRVLSTGEPEMVLPLVEECGVRRPSYKGLPLPIEELTWLK